MQIIILLFFYILQTTFLAKIMPTVRPDLFLILLASCTAGKGLIKGLMWGLIIGLFLDIFSAFSYFHLYLYSLSGIFFGFVPVDYFRSYRLMLATITIMGTIIIYALFGIAGQLVYKNWLAISLSSFLFVIILNGLTAYYLAKPLAKMFGTDVRD